LNLETGSELALLQRIFGVADTMHQDEHEAVLETEEISAEK
jgi:hypothetical protein